MKKKPHVRKISKVSLLLIAIFLIFLVIGCTYGGFGKVLANGAIICLECIGLV